MGNKSDLLTPTLSLINNFVAREDDSLDSAPKKSVAERIKPLEEVGVKYFQISTKCSTKKEIEAIFL